jgi:prepilin-type N-terminal cleavage/methylation domain-containing protein
MSNLSYKADGFTLIETLVTISILIVLMSIAIPSFADFTIRIRVDNELSILQRQLFIARNTAINDNSFVTLCPLNNKNECHTEWKGKLSVFTDLNNNKIYEHDLGERIISEKSSVKNGDELQYGKTRTGLTYAPTGHLSGWGQNATFKYCPNNHMDKSRGIVIAVSGRIYLTSSNNKSYEDRNRSGRRIICDDR